MMVVLRQVGIEVCERDRLNMSTQASASIHAQVLRARPGMLSGPATFRGFIFLRVFAISADVIVNGGFSVLPLANSLPSGSVLRASNYVTVIDLTPASAFVTCDTF